jgi:hypothetical protein
MQENSIMRRFAGTHAVLQLLLMLLLSSCAHRALTPEQTLVEKIIDAYGGKVALAGVQTLSAEGTITRFMSKDEGTYTRFMRRDGNLLVSIAYSNSLEVRLLNGPKGYRGAPGQLKEVSGDLYRAMVYQYNQLDLPFGFLDNALKITAVLTSNRPGEEDTIRCKDRAGNALEVTLRRSDYRIVKTTGYFQVNAAMTSLSAEFGDFRMVDGVVLPFTIVNYAGGTKISVTKITSYRINPFISGLTFSVEMQ